MSLGYLFVIQALFHNCRPSVLGDRSSIKGSGLFGCRMSFYVMFFFFGYQAPNSVASLSGQFSLQLSRHVSGCIYDIYMVIELKMIVVVVVVVVPLLLLLLLLQLLLLLLVIVNIECGGVWCSMWFHLVPNLVPHLSAWLSHQ